jgi:hypothetical protein
MEFNVLAALLEAGTVTHFKSRYGVDGTGIRGAVVQIGSPLNKELVTIVDTAGYLREFDRRTMRLA